MRMLVACGEVPWERALLAAAAEESVQVVRRHVDLAGLTRAVASGTRADVVITSPALRGFDERGLHAVAAAGVRVLVLLDDIEPPWLAETGFPCIRVQGVVWAEVFAHIEPANVEGVADEAPITVFAGVSGGVGTSSLASVHAARTPGSLLIDAALGGTSLAFLHGLASTSSTLMDALAGAHDVPPGLLTLAPRDAASLGAMDLEAAMARIAPDVHEVVVDAGVIGSAAAEPLVARAARVCLVGAGTPLGLVRICSAVEHLRDRELLVIVNGVRPTALGTGRPEHVARRVIEEHLGRPSIVIPFAPEAFDAAWLRGLVAPMLDVVPSLPLAATLPSARALQVASAA